MIETLDKGKILTSVVRRRITSQNAPNTHARYEAISLPKPQDTRAKLEIKNPKAQSTEAAIWDLCGKRSDLSEWEYSVQKIGVSTALLTVCHDVHEEASTTFWRTNIFGFEDPVTFGTFLETISWKWGRTIKQIQIQMYPTISSAKQWESMFNKQLSKFIPDEDAKSTLVAQKPLSCIAALQDLSSLHVTMHEPRMLKWFFYTHVWLLPFLRLQRGCLNRLSCTLGRAKPSRPFLVLSAPGQSAVSFLEDAQLQVKNGYKVPWSGLKLWTWAALRVCREVDGPTENIEPMQEYLTTVKELQEAGY